MKDLNHFIEVERAVQTEKILRRHSHIGRDMSEFEEEMERSSHHTQTLRSKENIFHNDFFNMQ